MNGPDLEKEALLARAAARVTQDSFFLSATLERYRAEHGLSIAELAAQIGCPPARLSRLALCRLPDAQSPGFRAQVEQVAAYAGADPLRLARLLREVAASQALSGDTAGDALLAARDLSPSEEQP